MSLYPLNNNWPHGRLMEIQRGEGSLDMDRHDTPTERKRDKKVAAGPETTLDSTRLIRASRISPPSASQQQQWSLESVIMHGARARRRRHRPYVKVTQFPDILTFSPLVRHCAYTIAFTQTLLPSSAFPLPLLPLTADIVCEWSPKENGKLDVTAWNRAWLWLLPYSARGDLQAITLGFNLQSRIRLPEHEDHTRMPNLFDSWRWNNHLRGALVQAMNSCTELHWFTSGILPEQIFSLKKILLGNDGKDSILWIKMITSDKRCMNYTTWNLLVDEHRTIISSQGAEQVGRACVRDPRALEVVH